MESIDKTPRSVHRSPMVLPTSLINQNKTAGTNLLSFRRRGREGALRRPETEVSPAA
jgi:hypothetical protein